MIKRLLLKIIFLSYIAVLITVGSTNAYFSDSEMSLGNAFTAGILDLTSRSGQGNFVSGSVDVSAMKPGESVARDVYVGKTSNSDSLKHKVSYQHVGGDEGLCDQLQLRIWYDHYHCHPIGGYACRDMRLKYNGSLAGLNNYTDSDFVISHPDDQFDTDSADGTEQWFYYSITLPADSDKIYQGLSCQFNFNYQAWQENSDGSWGFTDEEILSGNNIGSGDWTQPIITNVEHLIATPGESNEPKAIITWETDELATSNLDWKTSLADPWILLPDDTTTDQTSHFREITGLASDTTYYFQVKSKDSYDNEAISITYTFSTDGIRWGVGRSDIVINEFLPNPLGDDSALMPEGEWVELYNRGSSFVNLSGWFLTDANPSHRLPITTSNTTSSDPSTSGLIIGPSEFMVVYRDGDSDFTLNNWAIGDRVQLWKPWRWFSILIDIHTYTVFFGDEVLENKSFARIPDGSHIWFDPIPTPGAPNQLEDDQQDDGTSLEFYFQDDNQTVGFTVSGDKLSFFDSLNYLITYDTEDSTQAITGSREINGVEEIFVDDLVLGTCSTDSNCVYHQGVGVINLEVVLMGPIERTLTKELSW